MTLFEILTVGPFYMLVTALVASALRPIADGIDREWAQRGAFAIGLFVAAGFVWLATNGSPSSGWALSSGTGPVNF